MLRDDFEALLPPLYAQEALGDDATVFVHFFNPCGIGDWWITEGSREGDDFIMFGLCDLGCPELGYVSLNEMQAVRGPLGLGIDAKTSTPPTPPIHHCLDVRRPPVPRPSCEASCVPRCARIATPIPPPISGRRC